ncbi:response regulator [Paenibacillus macerans]|uniref:response regulator n=1 Tax=Paenibacillus macerans TaxID=44252 RepID=UPI00203BA597|nr:response regulator [Paenibacillus macerans]MCM3702123.1 response regulator [Paenibacillus macerans]
MLRTMIVDDEELSLKRLSRILAESGRVESCRTFQNPYEAYEYVKSHPIDVAFLDISMPEIDGMKLSSRLQELDEAIYIVFVTGYDSYAVQAFELSALDYLLKPVTVQRVAKTLDKVGGRGGLKPPVPELDIRLFNGFQIYRSGLLREPLKLRSPKTIELFAYLICRRTVSREEIIDTLWSGLAPENAWKNLNSTLYYIRKAIDESKTGSRIISGKNEIRIEAGGLFCDLYEFERLLTDMRQAPESSSSMIKRAEALYAGPLLKGKTYEWAADIARRLEQDYIRMLEHVARQHLGQEDFMQALHYFCVIMELDALREDIALDAIRIYIRLGRKNEALRQYRKLEELLRQELGVLPNEQIRAVITTLKS